VTQFGYVAVSESPGQPEKLMTVSTPISAANWMVSRNDLSSVTARSALGWSGLP